MQFHELNLDGLVGPTHHYAGLSQGNLASTSHALNLSNPQAAALQGLAKMRLLAQLGLKQAILPPHQRPNLRLLHRLGFRGTAAQQIEKAYREAPELLEACYSASSMWAANAATVTSSLDSSDHRVQFTAANLISNLHRYQEADFSKYLLEKIFDNEQLFKHHPILPGSLIMSDEGAANHCRLCLNHGTAGVNLFVYGKKGLRSEKGPAKYPARQTLEASQAIARSHQLEPNQVVFACQNPKIIDQGVFHNDVIAVANESVLLIHEEAFVEQTAIFNELRAKTNFPLQIIEVPSHRISVAEAVKGYLFNSQLITLPSEKMALIAPVECQENKEVQRYIDELIADETNPVSQVHYLDLKQSMQNGGGPACLRLRIPLAEYELRAMHEPVLINEPLLDALEAWVICYYRNQLHADDLADPLLIDECFSALEALGKILKLGSIYPFQH